MKCQLEHANITVEDMDETVRFLSTAFPHFKERGGGKTAQDARWLHFGKDDHYIALQEAVQVEENDRTPYNDPDINHLGYAVDDVDSIKRRLQDAGYEEGMVPEPHPYRKRVYFYDRTGFEWEFVQYYSDEPKERNDYSQ